MPEVDNPKRVVVIDDHAMVREAVGATIEMQPGYTLVGAAEDGAAALDLLVAAQPDVAVVDFALPDMTGLEVIEQARGRALAVRFLLLTGSHLDEDERAALAAAADGFLHKEAGRDALLGALDRVASQPLRRTGHRSGVEDGEGGGSPGRPVDGQGTGRAA